MKKQSIFSILKKYKGLTALLTLFTIASGALNLVLPKIIAFAVDAYGKNHTISLGTVVFYVISIVLIFVFTYLVTVVQVIASERVARDMRRDLSHAISLQSFSAVESVGGSKLLTNLTSDADAVNAFVSQAFPTIVSSLFLIIGASALLVSLNWKLGLMVLGMIPIIGFTFGFVFSKIGGLFRRSQEVIDRLNKIISDTIMGSALVRVLNSQMAEQDRFITTNTEALGIGMSILKLFASMIPIITFISNLAMVVILVFGGHLVIIQSMTIGDFTAFQSYVAVLVFPMLLLGFMSNVIAAASASYNRITQVQDMPVEQSVGTISKSVTGAVVVKDIALTLGGKHILRDISFEIKPGTKTAIVGPTGGGKTQLLYVLIGLLKPTSGAVVYDGVPLDDFEKQSLYSQVGMVFQDSIMFNLSIRENITFGSTAKEEALHKAIETAELSDYILNLPRGLETIVSERGTTLSGGQKQRIMLARALALDPKILLLDDFTARVDTMTEHRIVQNLERNYPDLTLISITQKIAPIEHYDQIILVMEGEVLAVGTHNELLTTSPEYAQIVSSQQSTTSYEELPS